MACGSGCCGSRETPDHPASKQSAPVNSASTKRTGDDAGSCCQPSTDENAAQESAHDKPPDAYGKVVANDENACCQPKYQLNSADATSIKPCADACCSPQDLPRNKPVSPELESCNSSCCSSKAVTGQDLECKKKCCDTTRPPSLGPAPSCCEGKTSPCCDTTCLDRLALRECVKSVPTSSSCGSSQTINGSSCKGGRAGKPCAEHSKKARQTYADKLESLGCICRALLALGQESCCLPKTRTSCTRPRSPLKRPSTSSLKTSGATGCRDACCEKTEPRSRVPIDRPSEDRIYSSGKDPATARICPDTCCGNKKPQLGPRIASAADLEKGLRGINKEYVVLSVSGMTCTGCETKLQRTLATLPAVQQLKVSLVLSRAEFDITEGHSVEEVIKHVERTTEFKCERVSNKGSSIDVMILDDVAHAFIDRQWPHGVTGMTLIGKEMVCISFDAKIIGARDLLERDLAGYPVELAPPRPDPTRQAGAKHIRYVGLMTLISIILTIPVLVMAWAPLAEHELAYSSASLGLATIIQVVIAGPFYPKALKSLVFSKMIEMDLLIVLSTSAAYIFSVVSFGYMASGRPLSSGQFFETSTLLVTLIMVGRYVSALARHKAVESISVQSLQTQKATIVTSDGQKEIDARILQYGDIFVVAPEAIIPTDGTILAGKSEVNESMITGESLPVVKQAGAAVVAGSVNGSGTLTVRLTRVTGDNTINAVASMVDEAKLSKPKIQDIADRVASYFVPGVVALTMITFIIWIAVGINKRGQTGSEATVEALTYAITVLIVSCPCAIGLAVPMVIVIASGVAAERGVVFKSAEAIQIARKTEHVVFDKTGTLTKGRLNVVKEAYTTDDEESVKALLLGLLTNIKHPVSVAVASHLKSQGISPVDVSDPKSLVGKGVEGTSSTGALLQAGNSRWLSLSDQSQVRSVLANGYTALCFTINGALAAVFGLEDSLRPDAASTVATLVTSGIAVHIISGDDHGTVCSVAAQLNIPETNIRSRCSPGQKRAYLEDLLSRQRPQGNGRHRRAGPPVVIFCGDGTNDAAALAQATIGIHMHEGGTAIAQSAADVVLMRPDLGGVVTAMRVSRKAMRRVAFNFGWSFVYNLFAVLLGAGAFVSVRIPPEFAGLGELVSVLPVIAAALLLRWSKV